jgi:hypothetical protein
MAIDFSKPLPEMDFSNPGSEAVSNVIPENAPVTNYLVPPSSLKEEQTTNEGRETKTTLSPSEQSASNDVVTPSALDSPDTPPPIGEGVTPGSFSVPRAGSRVWIFFHGGDIQKPVYFAQSIIPTGYTDHYSNPAPDPVYDTPNSGSEGENTPPTNPDTVIDETTNELIVEPPLPIEGGSSTTNTSPQPSYTFPNGKSFSDGNQGTYVEKPQTFTKF